MLAPSSGQHNALRWDQSSSGHRPMQTFASCKPRVFPFAPQVLQCQTRTVQNAAGLTIPTAPTQSNLGRPEEALQSIQHAPLTSKEQLPRVYGRDTERAMLARMGALQPVEVTLFTGPPNSGKTALLKDYSEQRQHQGVCYIDSRMFNTANPASLTAGLISHGIPALLRGLPAPYAYQALQVLMTGAPHDLVKKLEPLRSKTGTQICEAPDFKAAVTDARHGVRIQASVLPEMEDLFDTFGELLKVWQQARDDDQLLLGRSYPVFIIDEVAGIKGWSDKHQEELGVFMRFLVGISKQQLAHVWLTTSDWGVRSWLTSQMGAGNMKPIGVGDLQEEAAKGLLYLCLGWTPAHTASTLHPIGTPTTGGSPTSLVLQTSGAQVTPASAQLLAGASSSLADHVHVPSLEERDAVADRVLKVVGGNPGLLLSVGTAMRIGQTLEEALKPHLGKAEAVVKAKAKLGAGNTTGPEGYTSEQFAIMACMILDGNGACSKEAVEVKLGSTTAPWGASSFEKQKAGQGVLEALQDANAIALDHWLPATAAASAVLPMPSVHGLDYVVTAPSAFDLHCWQQNEESLRRVIKDAEWGRTCKILAKVAFAIASGFISCVISHDAVGLFYPALIIWSFSFVWLVQTAEASSSKQSSKGERK